MNIARAAASRSTCSRLQVGAVLVQGKSIRGTGYNGAPSGMVSCLEAGCRLRGGRCIRSVHAEANLVLQTDADDRQGAAVYVTAIPCWNCALLLANSGIHSVVYDLQRGEEIEDVSRLFLEAGISLREIDK